MILNILPSGFMARSVGSETLLSGSWICMLLSIAVLDMLNNDTFDNLVVGNIIQRRMEHGTSNSAWISCIISWHLFLKFWRSRTPSKGPFGVKHQKMVGMNLFRKKLKSNSKRHSKRGVVSKKFDVSCRLLMIDSIITSSSQVEFSCEAEKCLTVQESGIG